MNDLNNMPDADDVEEEEMADIVDDEENSYSQRSGERKIIKSEFKHEELREIGSSAIWSLSSWKHGNGVDKLRDDNFLTYWQSDGTLPHLVNIQFPQKVNVVQISLWLNYKSDESYTPNKITIRAGTHNGDLQDLRTVELDEPLRWVDIQLSGDEILSKTSRPVGAHLFQIAIKANHQNGKDTHIRQIKVFAPKLPLFYEDYSDDDIPFKTVEFAMHETIR
ncbi:anaphase-promoting complex, subunit 10 [Rhizophagus irregularis]|uniref:Anaphase-promoting complex subunit 10 n=1 Tax=Rhizophagus irregularis TaxID=588596 RepID=A0A2N1NRD7_9GLOM|nr:anaphase-promoting complex, subunit 10 [Rhizophagus irregularis]